LDYDHLKTLWKAEEACAFEGWDFSRLDGRWESLPLPWDYRAIVLSALKPHDRLLDMGTGGGEFLLTLGHPYNRTAVTEAYPPNVALCKEKLQPLGITVKQVTDDSQLPFGGGSFDIVISRHESFDAAEVYRILKPGGRFITQQVGGRNDEELSLRLIEGFTPQFPGHTMENNAELLRQCGFEILRSEQHASPLRFFDVGAVVYFARIIEWEFPGFSVDACFEALCGLQAEIEERGCVEATEERFLIDAVKR
jgi:SAM-dependent methyltransferase